MSISPNDEVLKELKTLERATTMAMENLGRLLKRKYVPVEIGFLPACLMAARNTIARAEGKPEPHWMPGMES